MGSSSDGGVAAQESKEATTPSTMDPIATIDPVAPIDLVQAISIEPTSVVMEVTDRREAVEQIFSVQAVMQSGKTIDVSTQVEFELSDSKIGRVALGQFSTGFKAGAATLTARYQGYMAEAHLKVLVRESIVVPSEPLLPIDIPAIFDSAEQIVVDDQDARPVIAYPFTNTMFPPNMASMDLHFLPGDSSMFRVRFETEGLRITFYTRCQVFEEGCQLKLSEEQWESLSQTAAGMTSIRVSIEGMDDGNSFLLKGEPISFEIAPEAVEGGLYYWETSNQAVRRVDFGHQGVPETVLSSTQQCIGCHALAPNGKRMSSSVGGQEGGWLQLIDLEKQIVLVQPEARVKAQFQSWSPDSMKLVGVWSPKDIDNVYKDLTIFDGETAQILHTITLTDNNGNSEDDRFEPSHPDWSPAGDRIAFTKVTQPYTSQRFGRGGIAYVKIESGQWSNVVHELVPPKDGFNHYSPAYAPTGEFVLYARSVCGQIERAVWDGEHPCNADTDLTSQIWAIHSDGGMPILLRNLNLVDQGDELTNTFPKWAPFVDARTADKKGRLMWVTFSSRRRAGLHKQHQPRSDKPVNQLLWMAAIDPDAIIRGEDGSYAPFALPFQDFETSNHLAQWTQKVVSIDPTPSCKKEGEECSKSLACCSELYCAAQTESYSTCVLRDKEDPAGFHTH
ncbi:MAG: hypothetical protein KTR25_18555 [Myxococcales bacterium]|nr:hypothetical protein [Myxococcales bacterium]